MRKQVDYPDLVEHVDLIHHLLKCNRFKLTQEDIDTIYVILQKAIFQLNDHFKSKKA